MGILMDLTNRRFGKLTVIKRAPNLNGRATAWYCMCDCGNPSLVIKRAPGLLNNESFSCGCDIIGNMGVDAKRLYKVWNRMVARCHDSSNKDYYLYGARGIRVHPRWHTFACFYKDVGDAPAGMSLDRPDNDSNYGPDNWRWADAFQQARNTRKNRFLEFNGEKLCVAEWAEKIGIPGDTLKMRIRNGWSVERALTTPVRDWAPNRRIYPKGHKAYHKEARQNA